MLKLNIKNRIGSNLNNGEIKILIAAKLKNKSFIFFIIAVIIMLTLVIAFIDSNIRIVTTEYIIYYPNLPEAFDGFRIVVISDLHGYEFGRNNEYLIKHTTEAEPDIIVITGDLIDEYGTPPLPLQFEVAEALVKEVVQIAPVYFVTGNHDWATKELPALKTILEAHNVIILQNSYVLLKSGSQTIILAGTDDPNGPADMIKPREFVRKTRAEEGNGFIIILEHRNRNIRLYSELGVDLVLSGHAHGGIIRLPFTDGLIASRHDILPRYASGINTMGTTNMVVSRGLGSPFLWMRLFNNPEVVVVELRVGV